MSDAVGALRRLLALLPLLGDEQPHPIDELAARVDASPDALLAELLALGDRPDDPAGFVAGITLEVEGSPPTVRGRSSHLKRPMRLTWSERHALELGLAALQLERPADEQGAIARARAHVAALAAPPPRDDLAEDRRRVAAYRAAPPEVLHLLQEGVRRRQAVRVAYRRGDAEAATIRTVHPYGLVLANGTWYCPAWCGTARALRIFRLDRIEHAEATGEGFERPDDFDVAALVHDGRVFQHEGAPTMTVRYSARIARWIAEREGRTPDADGTLTLEHPLADLAWGVRHVLQYGPDAEGLAPDTLRDEIRRRLAALARHAPPA
jgi:proteasome accessory factor C